MCAKSLQPCPIFATLWTVACQTPVSMGFSRQEYWSGLPCPAPGDPPHPRIKPALLMSPALAAGSLPLMSSGKPTGNVKPFYKFLTEHLMFCVLLLFLAFYFYTIFRDYFTIITTY